jgi:uncharacterized C2H2 Zn-finger protein
MQHVNKSHFLLQRGSLPKYRRNLKENKQDLKELLRYQPTLIKSLLR